MHAVFALLRLDLSCIRRDNVMTINLVMMVIFVCVLVFLRYNEQRWNLVQWYPIMLMTVILSGAPGFGFLFGMQIVEEMESGVHHALSVSPMPALVQLITRTLIVTAFVFTYLLVTVYVTDMIRWPFPQWFAVIFAVGLASPMCVLMIPAVSKDKIQALGIFKAINLVCIIPVVSFLLPADAWYRKLLLVSPTGPSVEGARAFLAGDAATGYLWCTVGASYMAALIALAIWLYNRKIYKLST